MKRRLRRFEGLFACALMICMWSLITYWAWPQDAGLLARGINETTEEFQQADTDYGTIVDGTAIGGFPVDEVPHSDGTGLITSSTFKFINSSGQLRLSTNGTAGGVKIGSDVELTRSASGVLRALVSGGYLHVAKDTGSLPTIVGSTVTGVFSNTSAAGDSSYVFLISGNAGGSQLNFGDTDDAIDGFILYSATNDLMQIGVDDEVAIEITNAQDVGIGRNSPNARLHVGIDTGSVGTISASTVAVFSSSSFTGNAAFTSIIAGTAGEGRYMIGDSATEAQGWFGYDNAINEASIGAFGSYRVRISGNGDVAIGGQSPTTTALLYVKDTADTPILSEISDAATNTVVNSLRLNHVTSAAMVDGLGSRLVLGGEDNGAVDQYFAGVVGLRDGADTQGALVLETGGSGALTERLRIANSGNVGINDSSPDARLDIVAGPNVEILRLQAHASQTDNIFTAVDNSGTELVSIGDHGGLHVTHEAEVDGDHALEITMDTGTFTTARALEIALHSEIGAGEAATATFISIDAVDSNAGTTNGIIVTGIHGTGTEIHAFAVGAGIHVLDHSSGIFGDMDSALSNAVDVLTAFTSTGTDVQIWVADNDTVTIGDAAQFTAIQWDLAIEASGAGIDPLFEFSTGVGTWSTFNPLDGTIGMRLSGNVAWFVSDIPTWAVGTGSEFLIRITRQRNSLTTVPTENKVQISATTLFGWDEDAEVTISKLGVGTLSPSALAHVAGDAGTIPALAAGTHLLISDNAGVNDDVGLAIISGTAGLSEVNFGDSGDSNAGLIMYDNNTDILSLRSGGSGTHITVDSAGDVGVGVASATAQLDVEAAAANKFVLALRNDSSVVIFEVLNSSLSDSLLRMKDNAAVQVLQINSAFDSWIKPTGSRGFGVGTSSPPRRLAVEAASVAVARFNRTGSDGTIIEFQGQSVTEGTISVSGTTVSYNGFTGSHYAEIADPPSFLGPAVVLVMTGSNSTTHADGTGEIVYGVEMSTALNQKSTIGTLLSRVERDADFVAKERAHALDSYHFELAERTVEIEIPLAEAVFDEVVTTVTLEVVINTDSVFNPRTEEFEDSITTSTVRVTVPLFNDDGTTMTLRATRPEVRIDNRQEKAFRAATAKDFEDVPLPPDREPDTFNPLLVASVGNGEMRVFDAGLGNVEPGDPLISSTEMGHGQLIPGTISGRIHVIGRAGEPIDWSTIRADRDGEKKAMISVLFDRSIFIQSHTP